MVNRNTKKLPLTSDIVFKRVFSREDSKDMLKALLEAILEITIKEIEVKNPEANTKLEQWLWLLAGREEKIKMGENKEIEKAMKIIEEMSLDEKEWELYRSRQMAIMDYNVGMRESREEGREEGERKKQIEIAKRLLSKNLPIDEIVEITELTKEEIEKL